MSKRTLVALLLVASGVAAGLVLAGRLRSAEESQATAAAPAPVEQATASAAAGPDFTRIASRAIRTVTNISSMQVVRSSPFATDPFFRHFFGDDPDLFGWREQPSLGSGVIVSPDGYILTNQHVIGERAAEVRVTLADRRERRARVVGMDEMTDVALLKVDASGLPTNPWGDSSNLTVAEWVLAIGNPFQLNQTVTLGIVSAVGRTNLGLTTYEDFIQTDAAINPGNSGGALVNARGELVGINTAILSQTGGYQGVGLAVPSNLARRVMDDLIKYGAVRRGSIGYLEVQPVTPQLADELGLREARGALVWRMRRDSAAFDGGIRPGDVIVSFNGQRVEDPSHFVRLLADAPIGGTVTLGVVRDGRERELRVRVEPRPTRRRP